jgi:hypothetical protein
MDDKDLYMRWLEEMWDVHKFDITGRTESEERRKEEILGMFRRLVELSEHRIDSPDYPPQEGGSLW